MSIQNRLDTILNGLRLNDPDAWSKWRVLASRLGRNPDESPVALDDVARDWSSDVSESLKGAAVLYHFYTYEDYCGTGYTVYAKDGKLYEAHGSHCSCNGLEGQWDPEETTLAAIEARVTSREYQSEIYVEAIKAIKDYWTKGIHA